MKRAAHLCLFTQVLPALCTKRQPSPLPLPDQSEGPCTRAEQVSTTQRARHKLWCSSVHTYGAGHPTSQRWSFPRLRLMDSVATGEHLEEMTPKCRWSTSSHCFMNGLWVWSVALSHMPAWSEQARCKNRGKSRDPSWWRDLQPQGAHCANMPLPLRQRDQKKQTGIHLHQIPIFKGCLNRGRCWPLFPEEALISFVRWGDGGAALHEAVYRRCKWGICCMQKAKPADSCQSPIPIQREKLP